MAKHITHKDMARFITDSLDGKKRDLVSEHLHTCESCGKLYGSMQKFMEPRHREKSSFSNDMLGRILNSYDEIRQETLQTESRPLFSFPALPKIAVAAAVIVVIAGIVLYQWRMPLPDERLAFSFAMYQGEVRIDDAVLDHGSVGSGEKIRLGKDDAMRLTAGKAIDIRISGESLIEITKAVTDRKTGFIELAFMVHYGTIISNIDSESEKINYIYRTPTAVITSLGTKFLIKVERTRTAIMVRKGRVKISAVKAKKKIITDIGKKYIIGTFLETRTVKEADMKEFAAIESITGHYMPDKSNEADDINKKSQPVKKLYNNKRMPEKEVPVQVNKTEKIKEEKGTKPQTVKKTAAEIEKERKENELRNTMKKMRDIQRSNRNSR